MSIAVGLLVAAGGVVLGRWLAHKMRPGSPHDAPPAGADGAGTADEALGAFPCRMGDVVVRKSLRDEAWLAGALVFAEEHPVGALFVAPEAGTDRAVFVREGWEGLAWLAPLATSEVPRTGEPPHTLEHGGVRFERSRRLPVRVRRIGTGTPPVGDRAVVAEYAGPAADRIVLVVGSERTLAWSGTALEREEFEVLPGDKTTQPAS